MNITRGALIGMAIGAVIGFLPGVIAGLFEERSYFGASIGHDASNMLRWIGLLIGGAAGSIIGAMAANASVEEEADNG
jgi:gas vesicle protein